MEERDIKEKEEELRIYKNDEEGEHEKMKQEKNAM
jgi:hypothetical protein